MRRLLLVGLLLVTFVLFCGVKDRYYLSFGKHRLCVELALTRQTRARGLMYRRALGKDSGMLFKFERPGRHCFWMKNTYLPLTIVFLDKGLRVIYRSKMYPLSLDRVCSPDGALYAIEAAQGWFEKRGIDVGSRVLFGKKLKKIITSY